MILFIETRRDVYTAEMWHFVLSWQYRFTSDSLSVSILMAIFPGGPWLAGTKMSLFLILLELRVMEVMVKIGAVRRAKLQSK